MQLEGLSRLDARYEHLNHAVQWRLACLAEQHRSRGGRRLAGAVRLTGAQRMVTQCKEWFNATPYEAPTRVRIAENARGMSSLFENYEKMLVHFLTASNITVCDGDLCHRMIEDLPPVERDHTVVGDNYQKVVL